MQIEAEFGADDDVLVHVHEWWNVGPAQDCCVEVVFVIPLLQLPAEVQCLVGSHVVLADVWLARYQEAIEFLDSLIRHHHFLVMAMV